MPESMELLREKTHYFLRVLVFKLTVPPPLSPHVKDPLETRCAT